MNIRKIYKELKELRERMVDPTEQQLKEYYEARNYLGAQVLRYEDTSNRMYELMRKIIRKKLTGFKVGGTK